MTEKYKREEKYPYFEITVRFNDEAEARDWADRAEEAHPLLPISLRKVTGENRHEVIK